MTTMKRILTILISFAAVGGAAFGLFRWREQTRPETNHVPYTVETRELARTVVERGWLVSLDTEPVELTATGELLEVTPSGRRVNAGDVVMRVDDADARERLEDVAYTLHDTEQDKASYEASYQYTDCYQTNNLREFGKRLEKAKLELADALEGLKPEERRQLEIELEIARLDLADATGECERQTRLLEKGFISEAMLEPYQRRVETLAATVAEVEARIRLEEKGMPADQLVAIKKSVERIQAQVDRGARAKERRLEAATNLIAWAEARIAKSQHDKARIEEELGATEVRAPRAGIMAVRMQYNRHTSGWTEYKPGEKRYRSDRLADIVNLGKMKVEIMVHEANIEALVPGTFATIRLPAFPGREFAGKVTEVGGVGRDRADVAPSGYELGRSGVTMFNATVSLTGNGVEFRPGMSAVVELIVEPARPRLVLRREAVQEREGQLVVLREAGGELREVPIKGRIFSATHIEVEEGLRDGDTVVALRERDAS
ncbi:MAG: hypothetical protein HN742_30825 [Lentisphaerae bacterium]|jgi:HlyD family secretion protein|nr:hypothetical protein [Lentisphaerota bacterium]MBT4820500.1 hypothetical protein [Lentisphaerota bacterium]MBT5609816.1 hypothetical protein [Lentisphaerota bacterium]MBT7055134.1 hypothetical protein [Lentisphaerota bacterium]MBT7846306.1 hypothetical protein [Lentisphaerota bacterium]